MSRSWPWKETPIKQRERIALSYRALAEKLDPDACAQLDAEMLKFGVRWIVPQVVTYIDTDLLDAVMAANYCQVNVKTMYVWRSRGLASVDTPDGIRFRFADLQRWVAGSRG